MHAAMALTTSEIWSKFAEEEGLDGSCLGALDAFRGADAVEEQAAPGRGDFDSLEAAQAARAHGLPEAITEALCREVDRDQAAMFARRLDAVLALLARLAADHPAARLLRSGLLFRAWDLLDQGPPLALRIRALVDFYYSNAAVLHHQTRIQTDGSAHSIDALVTDAPWRKVSPGFFHRRIAGDGPRGPLHVNALRFDRARFTFRIVDLGVRDREQEPFAAVAARSGAIAAVSGGFFLYSEPDIEPPSARFDPVGLLISDRVVLQPPVFRRGAFVQDEKGHCHIREIGLAGVTVVGPKLILIGRVNPRIRRVEVPSAFTRAGGGPDVHHPGPSLTFSGRRVTAASQGGVHRIPLNGFVLCLPDRAEWRDLAAAFPPGTEVAWRLPEIPRAAPLRDAIAAGPVLVRNGRKSIDLDREEFTPGVPPETFSEDETGDRNLLPRLAVGLTPTHQIVLAAVDGRNFGQALGMTLKDTARLMRSLGCDQALNLDGGSSKRMLLQGRTLDLPTTEIVGAREDEQPLRPVHTGILVLAKPGS